METTSVPPVYKDVRTQIQAEAISTWLKTKWGTICLAPGYGKSRVGATIAGELLGRNIIASVLVVAPKVPLLQQWKNEFEDLGYPTENIEFLCINTAWKQKKRYDLIIVDEIHLALSNVFKQIFSVKRGMLLGLTGTPPESQYRLDALKLFCPIVYTRTIQEAVVDNAVSDFTIVNIPVAISKKTRAKYNVFDQALTRAKMELFRHIKVYKFPSIFDMANKCKTDKLHPAYKASKEFWGAMTMRKKIVYTASEKIPVVLDILKLYPNRRWIIFTKSVDIAEDLYKELPTAGIYHYRHPYKEEHLQNFKDKRCRVLICVDALNQGLNVPDIDGAICMSFISTELTFIQQIARITRKTIGKQMPVFINLFFKDTVEETWLNKKAQNLTSVCLNSSQLRDLRTISNLVAESSGQTSLSSEQPENITGDALSA